MSRIFLTAALAGLWLIAFDVVPASVSNTPTLSGSAQAAPKRGTTVKSSKSNTSDRKGANTKPGNPPVGAPSGGRSY